LAADEIVLVLLWIPKPFLFMEEFKIIEEFPNYKINIKGEIYNIKTGKKIKHVDSKGYLVVNLEKNNRRLKRSLHVLMIEIFKEKKPNKDYVVNHINGIRSDFNIDNLEWCTQKYNIYHSRNITKNGAVISKQKIEKLYNENNNLSLKDFVILLIDNCK
jgi:hypothetical protein